MEPNRGAIKNGIKQDQTFSLQLNQCPVWKNIHGNLTKQSKQCLVTWTTSVDKHLPFPLFILLSSLAQQQANTTDCIGNVRVAKTSAASVVAEHNAVTRQYWSQKTELLGYKLSSPLSSKDPNHHQFASVSKNRLWNLVYNNRIG